MPMSAAVSSATTMNTEGSLLRRKVVKTLSPAWRPLSIAFIAMTHDVPSARKATPSTA